MFSLNGIFAGLALIVVLPIVWWHGRRTGLTPWEAGLRVAFVSWVAALVVLAFFPLPMPPYELPPWSPALSEWPRHWVSLVPFETIRFSIDRGWDFPAGKFLVGNIAAYVPLGLLAPMLSIRWKSWRRAIVLGLLASGLVETAQLVMSSAMGFPWRVADIDDLLLNMLGTLLGFAIWVGAGAATRSRHTRVAGS